MAISPKTSTASAASTRAEMQSRSRVQNGKQGQQINRRHLALETKLDRSIGESGLFSEAYFAQQSTSRRLYGGVNYSDEVRFKYYV